VSWRVLFTTLVLFAVAACASPQSAKRGREPLYLAIQVVESGKTIASPKVVGFEGKSISAERRAPGATEPDYRLVLRPSEAGTGYDVKLELELPSGHRSGHLGLLHGEERTVPLDANTELKVLLMRVDSPEFRALMDLSPDGRRTVM
jgi:hypothetical protein